MWSINKTSIVAFLWHHKWRAIVRALDNAIDQTLGIPQLHAIKGTKKKQHKNTLSTHSYGDTQYSLNFESHFSYVDRKWYTIKDF